MLPSWPSSCTEDSRRLIWDKLSVLKHSAYDPPVLPWLRTQLLEQQGDGLNDNKCTVFPRGPDCVHVSGKSADTVPSLPNASNSSSSTNTCSCAALHIISPCRTEIRASLSGGKRARVAPRPVQKVAVWVTTYVLYIQSGNWLSVRAGIGTHAETGPGDALTVGARLAEAQAVVAVARLLLSRSCFAWLCLGLTLHLEPSQRAVSDSHCGTMQHSIIVMKLLI